MATRSTIVMENTDGKFTSIYCHWDGYPDHNGRILVNHYRDESKIAELMKLGDLSALGNEIGEKHDFNKIDEKWCTAYKRDRGEKETDATLYASAEEFLADDRGQDYTYLYVNGQWECRDYNGVQMDLYKMIEEAA